MYLLTYLLTNFGDNHMTCCTVTATHGSATRFLISGEKYYIYFMDNLLLFQTVKEFSKSINS